MCIRDSNYFKDVYYNNYKIRTLRPHYNGVDTWNYKGLLPDVVSTLIGITKSSPVPLTVMEGTPLIPYLVMLEDLFEIVVVEIDTDPNVAAERRSLRNRRCDRTDSAALSASNILNCFKSRKTYPLHTVNGNDDISRVVAAVGNIIETMLTTRRRPPQQPSEPLVEVPARALSPELI